MTRLRRIARYAGCLIAIWLVGLLVIDVALEGATRRGIAQRLAESVQAAATIERGNLALVRGQIDLEDLAVRRDDLIGHLVITTTRLQCELWPLGLALVDRDCRELWVRGTHLEVSTLALWKLKRPERPPLHALRVVIDDARLELSLSALLPSLPRVVIVIEHAEAGETVFKTPLSFLFALRTLRATIDLPAGITLQLHYELGQLRVAGGIFGATPVALPIALPVTDLADDPRAEIARLIEFGKTVAEQLVTRKAEDWLKSKLSRP
ncbi:MAG TPA: hypothetical protein VHN14_12960 [Kofleriaceae bacterium]|nr:hypothetical protein [Kofleriaceae bacterium]